MSATLHTVAESDEYAKDKTKFRPQDKKELKFNRDECRAAAVGTCKLNLPLKLRDGLGHMGNSQFNSDTWCLIPPRNMEILNVSESITVNINKQKSILIIGSVKLKHVNTRRMA